MRVLHVFPCFGADLNDGAERYEYQLSAALAKMGIAVDVLATASRTPIHTSACASSWPDDYPAGVELSAEFRIERFPVRLSMPPALGRGLSRLLARRDALEARRLGAMAEGSAGMADYLHRRGSERPALYGWLAMAARGPWSVSLLRRLAATAPRYDLLLAGFMPYALMCQVASIARRRRVPFAALPLFHPQDSFHHWRPLYHCLSAADAILTQTSYAAALMKRLWPRTNPRVVGAGIDPEEMAHSRACEARFRARYELNGRRIVLFVGRKEHFKRYDLAIDAVKLIADPSVTLVMIGRDVDHMAIAAEGVVYLGELPRQDLLDAYDACEVFVLPSIHESLGMAFLEAWARHKPVVGNRACLPVNCLLTEAGAGLLASDPSEFAAAIQTLMDDPARARELARAGYEMVGRRYTWPAVAARVAEVYAEVAHRSGAGDQPG